LAVTRIAAEIERRVAVANPAGHGLARRTLAELTPERWTLEWHLPWWVGRAFGLAADACELLVTGNVLGLLALHLEDDLRDGDVPAGEVREAASLAKALLREAISTYATLLPPTSPFWPFLELALARWRVAQAGEAMVNRVEADRAAPVRVAGFAVCELTARGDRWPLLEQCLDHGLSALVRYDQLVDWEADLAAGRWNAFVAGVVRGPQDAAHRERNRAAVLVALLTGRTAAAEYSLVESDARAAASIAAELAIQPLATYFEAYAARTADQGVVVQRHYDRVADRAVEVMFGSRSTTGQEGR